MRTSEITRLNDAEFTECLLTAIRSGVRSVKEFGPFMVRQYGFRLLSGDTTDSQYWSNRLQNKIVASENILKSSGEKIIAKIVEDGKNVERRVQNVRIDVENANKLITLLRSRGFLKVGNLDRVAKKSQTLADISSLLEDELTSTVVPPPAE